MMAVRFEVWLTCDFPECEADVLIGEREGVAPGVKNNRSVAIGQGWRRRFTRDIKGSGYDLCPEHRHAQCIPP